MSKPENLAVVGIEEHFKVFLDQCGILNEFHYEIDRRGMHWKAFVMLRNGSEWDSALEDGVSFWHNETRANVNWEQYDKGWRVWLKALQEPFTTHATFVSMHGATGFTHFKEYDYKEVSLCDNCLLYMVKRDDGIVTMLSEQEFLSHFTTLTDSKEFKAEKKKSSSKYMVSVVGGSAPVKIHEDYDIAVQEAERIAKQPKNVGKEVYVLKVKKVYRSEIVTSEATL